MAASMGAVLLMAGEKGKRYVLPNSRVLLHQPLIGGVIQGPATDLGIQAKEMIKTRERLYQIMCHHTGKSMKEMTADCERDNWLDADQALAYGTVDQILTSVPDDLADSHKPDDA